MRSYTTILAVGVATVALLLSSGCVSKAEYDKALAACRRANDELLKSQEALRAAREDADALKLKLDQAELDKQAKDKALALADAKLRDLQAAFDKLKGMKGQEAELPPPAIGPVLPPALDKPLREFAEKYKTILDYDPASGMVRFKSDLTFDKGSDEVNPTAAEALGKLVEILNSPEALTFNVYVAGHTDDIPIKKPETLRRHPTNWYLSVHRSVEVEKVLGKAGLAPERIGVMGFSEYHPVVANEAGMKGNAKNRRVEIWIVPPGKFLTQPSASAVPTAAPAADSSSAQPQPE